MVTILLRIVAKSRQALTHPPQDNKSSDTHQVRAALIILRLSLTLSCPLTLTDVVRLIRAVGDSTKLLHESLLCMSFGLSVCYSAVILALNSLVGVALA